jgi:hypothetical protein
MRELMTYCVAHLPPPINMFGSIRLSAEFARQYINHMAHSWCLHIYHSVLVSMIQHYGAISTKVLLIILRLLITDIKTFFWNLVIAVVSTVSKLC